MIFYRGSMYMCTQLKSYRIYNGSCCLATLFSTTQVCLCLLGGEKLTQTSSFEKELIYQYSLLPTIIV